MAAQRGAGAAKAQKLLFLFDFPSPRRARVLAVRGGQMNRIVGVLAGWLAVACTAEAGCAPDEYYLDRKISYDVMVGSHPANMILFYHQDGTVEGVYAYAVSTADIVLRGRIEASDRLTLTEYVDGKAHATFEGSYPLARPGWGANNCQFAEGTWRALEGGKEPLAFSIDHAGSGPGRPGRLYQVADVDDDEVVNRAAMAFQRAVAERKPEEVAALARYPLRVRLGGKDGWIASREELLANYDTIFYPEYVELIRKDIPRVMMSTSQGVAFTAGIVWFDAYGRLKTLNN